MEFEAGGGRRVRAAVERSSVNRKTAAEQFWCRVQVPAELFVRIVNFHLCRALQDILAAPNYLKIV